MNYKYRPSSGTEGMAFAEVWCMHCTRDRAMREGEPIEECDDDELCPIIAATALYDVDDQKYPVEWIIDATGPRCTAFVPVGEKIPPPRCENTIDLFPEAA